jgi:Dolichyl-phosphate-mannose-protein mannosyltransferase
MPWASWKDCATREAVRPPGGEDLDNTPFAPDVRLGNEAVWKVPLLVASGLLLGALLIFHAPGINGPSYWMWAWRRLSAAHWYPLMALAAIPFFLVQVLYDRGQVGAGTGLVFLMGSTLLWEAMACHLQSPRGLWDWIRSIVENPAATSYHSTALHLLRAGRLDDPRWLEHYAEWQAQFAHYQFDLHALTKPAGAVLYHLFFLRWLGDTPAAALAAGISDGLLGLLAIPATYALIVRLLGDRAKAFCGASIMALSPGLILFLPEMDQIFPVLTCLLLILWTAALAEDRVSWGALFGLLGSLTFLLTYNLVVLGVFLLGYAALARMEFPQVPVRRIGRQTAAAGLVFLAAYAVLWLRTGYHPVDAFHSALANQTRVLLPSLDRPYPKTVPFDLWDFALGCGWIGVVLAGVRLFSTRGLPLRGRNDRTLTGLVVLQVLAVAVSGVLSAETARVWLFLQPLVALAAGAELAAWRPRHRWAVYATGWFVMAAIGQNMTFNFVS